MSDWFMTTGQARKTNSNTIAVILLISFVFTTVYSLFAGFLGFSQFVSGGAFRSCPRHTAVLMILSCLQVLVCSSLWDQRWCLATR